MSVTILVDNDAGSEGLIGEHGLAMLIETQERRILFDTGQGAALPANARSLGVDLASVDTLLLSHGHHDHTGGVAQLLEQNPALEVWAHPGVVQRRYSCRDGRSREIGMPDVSRKALERASCVRWAQAPAFVHKGVWLTGPIPRTKRFEDTGGAFYLDADCQVADPLQDDQAVILETREGVVVLLGCAHAGLVNTLDFIMHLTGQRELHAVVGGMHLLHAGEQRLHYTCEALCNSHVRCLAPCHCTGELPMRRLAEALPDAWTECHAGSRICFG